MTQRDRHPDEPSLPEALRRRLEAIHPAPAIPPEMDQAIVRDASAHLRRTRRLRLAWRWGGAAAAAAVLLVAIHLNVQKAARRSASVSIEAARPVPAAVTILDAYRLARQLEEGKPPDPSLDVNVDGRVDLTDVDALAQAAVRLDRGAR